MLSSFQRCGKEDSNALTSVDLSGSHSKNISLASSRYQPRSEQNRPSPSLPMWDEPSHVKQVGYR